MRHPRAPHFSIKRPTSLLSGELQSHALLLMLDTLSRGPFKFAQQLFPLNVLDKKHTKEKEQEENWSSVTNYTAKVCLLAPCTAERRELKSLTSRAAASELPYRCHY